MYDDPLPETGIMVFNNSFVFHGLTDREATADVCCVFGRSHNDFVSSHSVKIGRSESQSLKRIFSEGIDEVPN